MYKFSQHTCMYMYSNSSVIQHYYRDDNVHQHLSRWGLSEDWFFWSPIPITRVRRPSRGICSFWWDLEPGRCSREQKQWSLEQLRHYPLSCSLPPLASKENATWRGCNNQQVSIACCFTYSLSHTHTYTYKCTCTCIYTYMYTVHVHAHVECMHTCAVHVHTVYVSVYLIELDCRLGIKLFSWCICCSRGNK